MSARQAASGRTSLPYGRAGVNPAGLSGRTSLWYGRAGVNPAGLSGRTSLWYGRGPFYLNLL